MKVKYIEDPSIHQINWGGNDDPTGVLTIGNEYEAEVEVHSQHTKIIINGKRYNSVSFEYPKDEMEEELEAWRRSRYGD